MSPAVAVIVENTLQSLYTGLVLGCVYGLMCVGLALIFSVMRVINFAQGEFLMLGMYAALFVFTQLGISALLGPYVGPIVAAVLGGAIVFGVGIVVYEGLLRWITGLQVAGTEGEGHYPQLTLTLGLSLLLSNGGLIVFGSNPETMRTPMSSNAWELGPLFGSDITLFLNQARSVASVVALAVAAAVALFIARTPVTAIAGGLVATYYPFQPYIGIEFVIVMYAGVVLGGMGSVSGAFWGGLTIGLIQQLSTLVLPNQLQNAAIFVAFLLIVLLRPQGLFGRSVERV
ncbi:MAG: branched-chain amino acid ABC transporter permease [Betaproteobacteria bacterium]|nr:MAG: branched-chain amino acid ABC transporter permease [Betaproteobacteria bacterium]